MFRVDVSGFPSKPTAAMLAGRRRDCQRAGYKLGNTISHPPKRVGGNCAVLRRETLSVHDVAKRRQAALSGALDHINYALHCSSCHPDLRIGR